MAIYDGLNGEAGTSGFEIPHNELEFAKRTQSTDKTDSISDDSEGEYEDGVV